MKTAFATGPGFYAAATAKADDRVPPGKMRFFVARIEAYDGPAKTGNEMAETTFTILASMCEGKPEIARAMLGLRDHLNANAAIIEAEAKLPPS